MSDLNEVDYPMEATIGDQWARGSAERPRASVVKALLPRAEMRRRISQLAYDLYLRRGKLHGHDLEDWLAAESLILSQLTRSAKPTGDQPNGKERK